MAEKAIKAALNGLGADLIRPQLTATQPDMLGMLGLPQARPSKEGEAPVVRSRGRPRGAKNRRVAEWQRFLLSRYGSPLELLAQIYTAPAAELAARLKCSPIEALQEKRLAAIGALPYLHQRQPLSVDLNNRQFVHLHITDATVIEEQQGVELTATILTQMPEPAAETDTATMGEGASDEPIGNTSYTR